MEKTVFEGLADLEILQTKIIFFFIFVFFIGSIIYIIYNLTLDNKYIHSTNCNIISNNDGSFTQTITYTVNNKEYIKLVNPTIATVVDNVITNKFRYLEGNCVLYYSSRDPNNYNINNDPSKINNIFRNIAFTISIILLIFGLIYLFVLKNIEKNKNIYGIRSGVNIINSLTGNNYRYRHKI